MSIYFLKTIYDKIVLMEFQSNGNRFNDFDDNQKYQMYNTFKKSYEKSTGTSWDENKFYGRASEWLFFGDSNGFVTVRPQNSGYYKLTGVAGDIKSILKGINQLVSTGYPIWGMATNEIGGVLIKRYGFRPPNKIESFVLSKMIPSSVFGGVKYTKNSDGTITFDYPDVGQATKMFIANNEYYSRIKKNTISNIFKKKNVNEEIIDEKRAVDYYEENFKILKDFIAKHGYEKSYVSFRQTANTSLINIKNKFDTPTGLYAYPLKNFQDKIQDVESVKEFFSTFPFINSGIFAFLFVINNDSNIIFSLNTNESKIHEYINKIKDIYKDKQNVIKLCDDYYSENSYRSNISGGFTYNNEFQKFWLFLYEIANAVFNPTPSRFKTMTDKITVIAYKIGLDGFVDDGCTKTIHPNEPCQAVFFYGLRNLMEGLKIIHVDDRYDKPLPIDNKYVSNKDAGVNYVTYLKKRLGGDNIEIIDTDYSVKLKRGLPIVITVDRIPYYIKKDGSLFKEIRLTPQMSNNFIELAAYINTKFFKKYYGVGRFDEFGNGVALASYIERDGNRGDIFINTQGEPDLTNVDIRRLEGYEVQTAAYINQKYGKNFESVGRFGRYADGIATARMRGSGKIMFINAQGESDISTVDISKIGNPNMRAAYMNTKYGKNYKEVENFDEFGDGIALATYANSDGNDRFIFINTQGEPDISNVDYNKLIDEQMRAAYFNQKTGKNYYKVSKVNNIYGNGVILAEYRDENGKRVRIFINSDGEPDTTNVDVSKLGDSLTRAMYINTKFGKKYDNVNEFGKHGDGVALAKYVDGNNETYAFINTQGEADISNVDVSKINDGLTRATYINQKYGKNYQSIDYFGLYGDGVALAVSNDYNRIFINTQGEADISNVDVSKINDGLTRATYINQKYGKNFESVSEFINGKGFATTDDNGGEFMFINTQGEPDTSDITVLDLNNIDNSHMRAAYINKKYGKTYNSIEQFGYYGDGLAIAKYYDGGNKLKEIFINIHGEPDTSNIITDRLNSSKRAKYINQKYGKNYSDVREFGEYGDDVALASTIDDNSGNTIYEFINRQGEPDVSNADLNMINDSDRARTTYINQKYGKKYTLVNEFDNGLALAVYRDDDDNRHRILINSEGEPDISNVDVTKLKDSKMRAAYINTKYGDNYASVGRFNEFGDGVALATRINDSGDDDFVFINTEGKPDASNVDLHKLHNNNMLVAYFKQKYGKDYTTVSDFGEYGEGVALASYYNDAKNSQVYIFINEQGEPDISNVNFSLMNSNMRRAAYINTENNKQYYKVSEFGVYGIGVALATYSQDDEDWFFINAQGEPDISDVEINKLDSEEAKSAYEKQKNSINENIEHKIRQLIENEILEFVNEGKKQNIYEEIIGELNKIIKNN